MAPIDRNDFAEDCIQKALYCGVNADYLIAVAQLRSSIDDGTNGAKVGPFRLTQSEWDANRTDPEFNFNYESADISNWQMQCSVFALMTHRAQDALQNALPDKRFPTAAELYCAQLINIPAAIPVLVGDRTRSIRDALIAVPVDPAKADQILAGNAAVFLVAGAPALVGGALDAIANALQPALATGADLIKAVQPGLYDLPPPPPPPPGGTTTPWMDVAKAELAKNIIAEAYPPSNSEIVEYFKATTYGRPADQRTSWCAAYVSWCIKQSGGSTKHVTYSARAADWLNNGTAAGPTYGAVAVTYPLVSGSSGHVGFVVRAVDNSILLLAGNQRAPGGGPDCVCVKEFPKAKIRGYRMV